MEQTVPYPRAIRRFPTLRQSLLGSFDNCGLLTKFEAENRSGWSHSYQARGEMFHRFAARALATMAQLGEPSIPVGEALEILHEVLRQEDIDRVCPHCGGRRIRRGITRGGFRKCLSSSCGGLFETEWITVPEDHVRELYWVVKKWAYDNAFDVHNVVDVEKKLKAEIRYPNSITGGSVSRTITGTLDALLVEGDSDDHAIVIDWKDMWKLPPETEIGFGGYFQQRFYAYLIFANYPSVQQVTLREFYVRHSQPREATLIRSQVEEDIREEVAALVLRFDRAVEEHLWAPSPGQHCGFCPTPQKCPIHPEHRGSGRITSQAEADEVAAQLVVAQQLVKQYRMQLSPWTEMNGPTMLRDAKGRRAIGLRPKMTTKKPGLEQIDRLERELGRAPTAAEIRALYRKVPGTELTTFVPDPQQTTDEDEALIEALTQSIEDARSAA